MTGPKLHYASQFIIAAMDEWGGPVTPTTGTPVYLKQDYDALQAKVRELEERLDRVEQERDQLRARVGELEALNHKLNKALVFAEHGRTLERLQDSETQRALEGKEEHGTRRDG